MSSRSSRTLDARRSVSIWQVPVPRRVMVAMFFGSVRSVDEAPPLQNSSMFLSYLHFFDIKGGHVLAFNICLVGSC